MSKLILLLLLAQISSASLYPIFNGDRAPWMHMLYYDEPIIVDSGVVFGLTNPEYGLYSYDFRLEGDLDFDPINTLVGIHNGPGNIPYGITVTGQGLVSVYDGGVGVGEFTIVPEPATVLLFGLGLIIKRRQNE